ncbi:alpha-ketoglutarate decarboxylase [Salinimicrobium tongyeongense]|uniref:alpha-ketoglutarate decarboxylase n=1 Tax=Salinimicrobium tongyeongense TaxID=2809707 RepID=UPI0022367E28|nr:alpha-ketoglutarate decarboxylase [Salinimicrobium tongyeongense]
MNFFLLNKKKLLLLMLALYPTHSYLVAQVREVPKRAFWEDVHFGGSLGLNVNNGYFSGYVAPKAIYDFNAFASGGVGLLGSYNNTSRHSSYTIGGSLIGLLRPVNPLQLSAEFEEHYVSRDFKLDGANKTDSYWYPGLFLGLGYVTGPVSIGLRYDVLHDDEKSIYANALMPFVTIYF